MARGPNWNYYGAGTLVMHLTSGQSIRVEVDSFKLRWIEDGRPEYEWHWIGTDTLPLPPYSHLVAAIEHHPTPAKTAQEADQEARSA